MGAESRRIAIWHTLCFQRQITMKELAEMHSVSTRTIRSDIEHLSLTHPIETVRGRYNGCVKLSDWYVPSTNPLNPLQIDFLVQLQKTLDGTNATMMQSIISALSEV